MDLKYNFYLSMIACNTMQLIAIKKNRLTAHIYCYIPVVEIQERIT